jgi:hypothetical protein
MTVQVLLCPLHTSSEITASQMLGSLCWQDFPKQLSLCFIIRLYSPFVGPWPPFQFANLIHGSTPWTGYQPVSRPLPTHGTTQAQIFFLALSLAIRITQIL